MQELKFRNFIPTLFTFIVAVSASAGSSYIKIAPFELPIPLLIVGLLAGYLILNFISYPKATILQVIQLTITGIFINAASLVAAIFAIKYLKLATLGFDSDFILSINPITPAVSFFFSYITLISLVRFEDKVIKPKKSSNKNLSTTEIKDEQPEVVPFENAKNPEKAEVKVEKTEQSAKKEEPPKSLYEELYPQAKKELETAQQPAEESEFSFKLNLKETTSQSHSDKEKMIEQQEEFICLEELPSLKLNSVAEQTIDEFSDDSPSESKNENSQSSYVGDEEEYFDFIPTDIRLIDTVASKENDSKGKIASIGKLLVNTRDIEGVIESGEAMAETGLDKQTNVVSSVSGEQIYEKFNSLKKEFSHIKEIALIDKGGFALANDFEDQTKVHITGALIAGAYHTLQNYLAQISYMSPQKIFFETETSNNFILKTNNEFLFSVWDKEFKHIDYSSLEKFLENETICDEALTPLIELNRIINFAISDGEGNIIKASENNPDSEKLAVISSALFENLKVFLMNLQFLKLRRITIFNASEVITIQKFNNEIASFITPIGGLVTISEEFQKMEEIY